jgi:hypothetical protein
MARKKNAVAKKDNKIARDKPGVDRDKSGRFLPGNKVNPSGGPGRMTMAALRQIRMAIMEHTKGGIDAEGVEIIQTAIDIMRNGTNDNVRLAAVQWLGGYVWGNSPKEINIESESLGQDRSEREQVTIFVNAIMAESEKDTLVIEGK